MKPRHQASVDRALAFFKRLRIPDMIGKPTFAEAGRQWQFDFVANLFGGQDPDTLAQSIREAFLCVAKKNYKTGLGAGIILTAAHLQEREEDEALILAGTQRAAGTAFRTIVGMVHADDELAARYRVNNTTMTLKHRDTKSEIKVISLNNATAAGSRASFVLVDEVWTMGEMAKADGALQEATGGLTSRPEGFVLYTTTQSDTEPAGIFRAKLDYARKVKSGEIVDPSFLSVIYELPPGFDWRNNFEKAVELTNPNLGASVQMGELLRKYAQVKDDRTGALQKFLSKHINLEIGTKQRADNWAGAEYWERQQIDLTLDDLLARCEVVEVGIDGGGEDDLLGLYVLGREAGTRHKLGWGHAWCSPIVLERRKEIAPRLLDFAAAGELTIIDASRKVREVAELVAKVRDTGKLDHVAIDRFGIGRVTEVLEETGAAPGEIVGVRQGCEMQVQIQTCEGWLAAGELFVAKQSLMAWAVGNARIEQRANGIMVTKAASGVAKIDTVISMLNAVLPLSQNPEAKGHKKLVFFSLSH